MHAICLTLNCVRPRHISGFRKFRAGTNGDGGYVMLDTLYAGQIAYSVGIGGDVSWDLSMVDRGLSVFQYDHTVDGPPVIHPHFSFQKLGLSSTDKEGFTSLSSALRKNGHQYHRDLILKIDIEGEEWEVFDHLSPETLNQFSQILLEFHNLECLADPAWHSRAHRVFSKIEASHVCFHVHGNNWGHLCQVMGITFPDVLELSLVRRDVGPITLSDELFPTHLDYPNNPNEPDFFLGNFRFL